VCPWVRLGSSTRGTGWAVFRNERVQSDSVRKSRTVKEVREPNCALIDPDATGPPIRCSECLHAAAVSLAGSVCGSLVVVALALLFGFSQLLALCGGFGPCFLAAGFFYLPVGLGLGFAD